MNLGPAIYRKQILAILGSPLNNHHRNCNIEINYFLMLTIQYMEKKKFVLIEKNTSNTAYHPQWTHTNISGLLLIPDRFLCPETVLLSVAHCCLALTNQVFIKIVFFQNILVMRKSKNAVIFSYLCTKFF